MRNLRMVLTIKEDGTELYSVQVRSFFMWFTEFSSTNKNMANNVYRKIAKAKNIIY